MEALFVFRLNILVSEKYRVVGDGGKQGLKWRRSAFDKSSRLDNEDTPSWLHGGSNSAVDLVTRSPHSEAHSSNVGHKKN